METKNFVNQLCKFTLIKDLHVFYDWVFKYWFKQYDFPIPAQPIKATILLKNGNFEVCNGFKNRSSCFSIEDAVDYCFKLDLVLT